MKYIKIHHEGYKIINICILIAIINIIILYFMPTYIIGISLFINILLIIFSIYFFRNPFIKINQNDNFVLSPANGRIISIEDCIETEFFNKKLCKISIFMSPFDIHVNRSPISGKITYIKYHPGKYYIAWYDKSSSHNEHNTIIVENNNNVKILYRQIAGFLARRIKCYINVNQYVLSGQEIGFIKFGSRLDIFLPTNLSINVNLNQKVTAGSTVLAFIHKI
ncbi:MAG: phosphatidylserine decarboxylase family protein [Bacteroides sp.]|nr:MAG: phosphatidylserine decarboxylase family protein [Bacteroides sp.]